ncbi:MAG: nucleotide exchange factor GrpE [bacterium]
MNEEEWTQSFKEELTAKFQRWLEEQDIHQIADQMAACTEGPECTEASPSVQMDLFSLFSELAALRQETKIASRQWKAGADQWEKTSQTLQEALETLQQDRAQRRKEAAELQAASLRPLLHGMLDIRDRLEQGIKAAESIRPTGLIRLTGGWASWKEKFVEGQKMTLRHLDRLLTSYGVSPIEAAGGSFDPFIMRALEVEKRDDLPNGLVIEEIRKGFRLDGEILRPAEVKVNKREKLPI